MHADIPSGLILAALLAGGCAAPYLRSAHSLDRGNAEFSVAGASARSRGSAQVISGDDISQQSAASGFGAIWLMMEGRIGLGKGFELGVRGSPLPYAADLKWSLLDERRMATPISFAVDVEGGIDYATGEFRYAAGMLMSGTIFMGRVALRPVVNVMAGTGSFTYEIPLPAQFSEQSDGYGPDPQLWFTYRGHGLWVPVGGELPIRLKKRSSLTLWGSYVFWLPIQQEMEAGWCDNCATVGVENIEPLSGGFLMVGLRVGPWLQREGSSR